MLEVKVSFSAASWEEKTYWEGEDGRKLTKVDAVFSYAGEMKGEGSSVWLLSYNPDGTGVAPALERFVGSLSGRSGSFVLQHSSTFDAAGVRDTFFISPGSGTASLAGISGEARLEMTGPGPFEFTLRYQLP
jgi:hypothetical protein